MIANSLRTLYLLALLTVIVQGLGFGGLFIVHAKLHGWTDLGLAAGDAAAGFDKLVPWLLAATMTWVIVALALNRFLIGNTSGARPIRPGSQPRLESITAALCKRAGMPIPAFAIIEADEMNAFASGLYSGEFTVTVTSGLLRNLTEAEIEGVIAHELSHIKNRDVRLMVMAVAVTGGIALLCEAIIFLVMYGARYAVGFAVGGDEESDVLSGWIALLLCLPLAIAAWFMTQLINLSISRTREYMADAGAAEMTGNPAALISALEKVSQDCDVDVPSGVKAMCIEAPSSLFELFSTHPNTEKRIAALRELPQRRTTAQPARRAAASSSRAVRSGFGRRDMA